MVAIVVTRCDEIDEDAGRRGGRIKTDGGGCIDVFCCINRRGLVWKEQDVFDNVSSRTPRGAVALQRSVCFFVGVVFSFSFVGPFLLALLPSSLPCASQASSVLRPASGFVASGADERLNSAG